MYVIETLLRMLEILWKRNFFRAGDIVDVYTGEIYDNTSLYMSSYPYNTFTGFRIAPDWNDQLATMQWITECIFLLSKEIVFILSIKFVYRQF